MPEVKSDEMLM